MQSFRPPRKLRAPSGPERKAHLDITCLNMQKARCVEIPSASLEYDRRKVPCRRTHAGIDGGTSEPETESTRTSLDNGENCMVQNNRIGLWRSKPGKYSNVKIVQWLGLHPPRPSGYERLSSSPWTLDSARLRRAWKEGEKEGATVSDAGYQILSLTKANIEFTMGKRGFRGSED